MPGPFEITPSTSTITLDTNRRGTVTFTVKNSTKMRMRGLGRLIANPPESQNWYTVDLPSNGLPDPMMRDFAPEGTNSYTVSVAVPATAASGEYRMRLVVANEINPDDDFTESADVGFHVAQPAPTPPPKFPIWIIPVILVGLVLIIAVIVLLTREPPPPPPPTETPTPTVTVTPSITPSLTPTPRPTATPTLTPIPLRITAAQVQVSPPSSSGCIEIFEFDGQVLTTVPGTVQVRLEQISGAVLATTSVNTGANGVGNVHFTLTRSVSFLNRLNETVRLNVIGPSNNLFSNTTSFALNCPFPNLP